jgi:ParB family chromosome partitioning protein
MSAKEKIIDIDLEGIDLSLKKMRMIRDDQIKLMMRSLIRNGQLQPAIVRKEEEKYQLIDGFKRYYATEELEREQLQCIVVRANRTEAKAMILAYNKGNHALLEYEEAMIVESLKKEDLLSGQEISRLLNVSPTWVSRRLGIMEKLSVEVQEDLKLGVITPSHVRNLGKLPRGNQSAMLKTITGKNITSHDSMILVKKYLQAKDKEEQNYILTHTGVVLENAKTEKQTQDSRLSIHGNRLLNSILFLQKGYHIVNGQLHEPASMTLQAIERSILIPYLTNIITASEKINPKILKMINNER